mmetsp:Transcript_1167/g.2443  ORF Transcript_1167/g.2443 Transcript_1167/m.2443 type:complete len:338 (-) Transcript_1167:1140-2153(-)|eukprot:CAMPEP_0184680860 /NCGR_PEP_ID=MMETSP0312-20130426/3782_1 /TAXON_ID=31354 /ORGANISM="Compsopogon coeruleus, Strain SAG 36.94" /LENGTH=337 /DNA_ID=CAMNT_0027131277 /DNA_START=73 /DNA_END=1086 /DNA_ORIENTATION=-
MIVSPLSPLGMRGRDVPKAATVFPSHVRRTFTRHPTDYTGELVRLLDDIATQTHGIATYVAESDETIQYGALGRDTVSAEYATRQLYRALSHDGYACILLVKDRKDPLTFPEDVPHGGYVVCMSPLETDPTFETQLICGTVFSVYKRISSTSLPGRYVDLQQKAKDQVAAGFCVYSSATCLSYTMGYGVHSFSLHPVAVQYFLQPNQRVVIPEGGSTLFGSRSIFRDDIPMGKAMATFADEKGWQCQHVGTFLGNTHYLLKMGGIVFAKDVDLLCEAAPIAFILEQAGGTAVNDEGAPIMSLALCANDDCHKTTSFVGGNQVDVDAFLKILATMKSS